MKQSETKAGIMSPKTIRKLLRLLKNSRRDEMKVTGICEMQNGSKLIFWKGKNNDKYEGSGGIVLSE